MSAYVVNDATIQVIVAWWAVNRSKPASFKRDEVTLMDLSNKASMLIAENVKSVNYRYDETEEPERVEITKWMLDQAHDITPAMVAGCCSNLEYQSCEHPDYYKSEAYDFLTDVRKMIINKAINRDNQPWGVSEFPKAKTVTLTSLLN